MRSVTEAGGGGRQRLTRDERRERIVEAAAEVFARRGYDGASLDEIADAAGISKPVIYDHFESKRELHNELLLSHQDQLLAFMAERVAQEQRGTTEDRLRAGLDGFFEFVETHPFAWRTFFRDPPASETEIVDLFKQVQRRATRAIVALMAAEKTPAMEGPDRDERLEMMAMLLKSATNGLATWWYEHRAVPRERLVELVMEFAWLGCERVLTGERWTHPERAPEPGPAKPSRDAS